jgi:hypothetical protein
VKEQYKERAVTQSLVLTVNDWTLVAYTVLLCYLESQSDQLFGYSQRLESTSVSTKVEDQLITGRQQI